jgi:hypothetical protein
MRNLLLLGLSHDCGHQISNNLLLYVQLARMVAACNPE